MATQQREFEAAVRYHNGAAIIDLFGEINAFAEQGINDAYSEAESREINTIILNFDEVVYINSTGIALIVCFVFLSALINMFMGSASAKWAIMAPIFVPMLMLMGYSPELTQAAYRVGDSYSNILTPLLPYFPLIIVFAQKYQKDLGIGTIISLMLPYAIIFMITRIIMLVIWMRTYW